MIILYIIIGLIAFVLLFTALLIFIPVKMFIRGVYWDKNPTGQMDIYWIKYLIAARFRIKDFNKIHILIWFFGIPIPFKLPLSADRISKKVKTKEPEKAAEEQSDTIDDSSDKESEKKKNIRDNLQRIVDAKDKVSGIWEKYKDYLKKIFVSYITFSLEYVEAELGLKDPAQTGKAAGILYSTLPFTHLKDVNITWDYQKPNFNISAGVKITMKLYGILCTLLQLYRTYKKDLKNET